MVTEFELEPEITVPRPKTRGECVGGQRPCPWVGCRHHLYLDVNEHTGKIKFNYPGVEPENLAESCSLDVADRGPQPHDAVAGLLNLARQRVHQIEDDAFSTMGPKMRRRTK